MPFVALAVCVGVAVGDAEGVREEEGVEGGVAPRLSVAVGVREGVRVPVLEGGRGSHGLGLEQHEHRGGSVQLHTWRSLSELLSPG